MGVPLFNTPRMMEEWLKAKRHIPCLQDPPGIELYTVTRTMQKGGQLLNTYCCARGSTSLESLHLHLNCFIPGSTASDLHFQAYLVEGLARWNQDQAQAATSVSSKPGTYSRRLRHVANQLSAELLDEPLYPDFSMPNKHTGELIGVEYMYSQTGRALQYVPADTEDAEKEDAGDDDEEEESADEGFHDLTEVDDMTMADASMVVFATSASYLLFCPDQMGRHHPTSNPHCKQSPTTPPPTPTASSLPPPTPYPRCKQSPTTPPPTPTYGARRTSSISATSSWPFLLTSQTTAFSTLCLTYSRPTLINAWVRMECQGLRRCPTWPTFWLVCVTR
ncbi:uncharacterized protein [Littorina saxatilis]|uniref:uncharacterized protein n=1 Tax=Littorina saxatilis TaxID=31220 RepID=UPI0038B5D5B4